MDAVVDTQPHRDDDVDAGHDVDVDIPEVEEAHNVHQGDADHGEHEAADLDVGQEHEGDEEDGDGEVEDAEVEIKVGYGTSW